MFVLSYVVVAVYYGWVSTVGAFALSRPWLVRLPRSNPATNFPVLTGDSSTMGRSSSFRGPGSVGSTTTTISKGNNVVHNGTTSGDSTGSWKKFRSDVKFFFPSILLSIAATLFPVLVVGWLISKFLTGKGLAIFVQNQIYRINGKGKSALTPILTAVGLAAGLFLMVCEMAWKNKREDDREEKRAKREDDREEKRAKREEAMTLRKEYLEEIKVLRKQLLHLNNLNESHGWMKWKKQQYDGKITNLKTELEYWNGQMNSLSEQRTGN